MSAHNGDYPLGAKAWRIPIVVPRNIAREIMHELESSKRKYPSGSVSGSNGQSQQVLGCFRGVAWRGLFNM